jgi:RNA polymerase sigma-70 factor (ECF subfamily)
MYNVSPLEQLLALHPPNDVTLSSVRTVLVVRASDDEGADWEASLANDANAFVSIFDRHRNRVYRHALRLTTNAQDAEDVTAAAFLELWRRRKTVRLVDGSVLPWLLVTTTNQARNVARSRRRYRALLASLPHSEDMRSAEDEALQRIEETRITEQVREALHSLTPSDAALIALTAFEHCSNTEVATVLGISEGAARTRLHRARARMAAVVGPIAGADGAITKMEESQ